MLKIGMLTSGGDCQGLNAALRGVAKTLYNELGDRRNHLWYSGRLPRFDRGRLPRDAAGRFFGYSDARRHHSRHVAPAVQADAAPRGGSEETKLDKMLHTVKKAGGAFDCLVILGGNGTHKTANLLSMKGVNVVTLPKTIDNDLWGTELTFGFQSAVDIASTVIDSIHSTAFSHSRVFIVEVMGHKAGWLTLYAGIASGADVIIIPEIPYSAKKDCRSHRKACQGGQTILDHRGRGGCHQSRRGENEQKGVQGGARGHAVSRPSPTGSRRS